MSIQDNVSTYSLNNLELNLSKEDNLYYPSSIEGLDLMQHFLNTDFAGINSSVIGKLERIAALHNYTITLND